MIDYQALAVSLFALALAAVAVLWAHALAERRRRRRKIVPDPRPWWEEFEHGKKFVPDQGANPDRWYCEYTRGPGGEV